MAAGGRHALYKTDETNNAQTKERENWKRRKWRHTQTNFFTIFVMLGESLSLSKEWSKRKRKRRKTLIKCIYYIHWVTGCFAVFFSLYHFPTNRWKFLIFFCAFPPVRLLSLAVFCLWVGIRRKDLCLIILITLHSFIGCPVWCALRYIEHTQLVYVLFVQMNSFNRLA